MTDVKAPNTLNIYQRMSLATEKIGRVAKNLSIQAGKNSYKAVSENDVIDAVKPIEIECGIYSYPYKRSQVESSVMVTKSEYTDNKTGNTNATEKSNLFMRLETVYRFVNTDNPAEYIETVSYGDGVDSQDKAPGKAMTYADKYALMKAYKIGTGDDPDAEASGELKSYQKKPDTQPNKPNENSQTTAHTLICPACKNPVVDIEYAGKSFAAQVIFNKYGTCWNCYQDKVRKEADARGV